MTQPTMVTSWCIRAGGRCSFCDGIAPCVFCVKGHEQWIDCALITGDSYSCVLLPALCDRIRAGAWPIWLTDQHIANLLALREPISVIDGRRLKL